MGCVGSCGDQIRTGKGGSRVVRQWFSPVQPSRVKQWNGIVARSKDHNGAKGKKMKDEELEKRLVLYFDIARSLRLGIDMGSGPLNECPSGIIVKFLNKPSKYRPDFHSVDALCNKKTRAYSYEPMVPGDEGWGVEEMDSYTNRKIVFPDFVLTTKLDGTEFRRKTYALMKDKW